jgi:type VI secretion system protein ImpM
MPVGAYGKYPAKRDYIAVKVPRPVLQPLETWLASGLATSRDRLGRRWQEHYMVQPVWNFRLGKALCGVECMGVMAPSVDGVGRTFPLVVIAYGASPGDRLVTDPAGVSEWLHQARQRLMLALSDDPPRDPEDLVNGLPDPILETEGSNGVEPLGKGHRALWGEGGQQDAETRIAGEHAARSGDHRSIWWCTGSALVCAQTVTFDGFPEPEFMVSMMCENLEAPVQLQTASG